MSGGLATGASGGGSYTLTYSRRGASGGGTWVYSTTLLDVFAYTIDGMVSRLSEVRVTCMGLQREQPCAAGVGSRY